MLLSAHAERFSASHNYFFKNKFCTFCLFGILFSIIAVFSEHLCHNGVTDDSPPKRDNIFFWVGRVGGGLNYMHSMAIISW